MDSQPTSPNLPGPGERPQGVSPEDLRTGEAPAHGSEAAPAPSPGAGGGEPVQPAPAPVLTQADAAAAAGITPTPAQMAGAQGPAVAGDVDVIEPEWVDKAEDVVRQTKGDPYREEEGVEDLQQDYLLKRYGHKVADPKATDGKPEGT